MMNFKELVAAISSDQNIPVGMVRKVAQAVVEQIKTSADEGEDLKLPGLVVKTVSLPAREAMGEQKARPERKRTVIRFKNRENTSGAAA